MNKTHNIFVAIATLASSALAYNGSHGPFPDDAKIEHVKLTELTRKSGNSSANADSEYSFPIPKQKQSQLNLVWQESVGLWFAKLTIQGKTSLPSTPFSDFSLIAGVSAFSADLNQDGVEDFFITSYSGGCGLASGYCNVAFILSSGDTYTLTTIESLFPDASNFILINKKPTFVHTSFHSVAQCTDGKAHNFWVYNLLSFDKDEIKVDNSILPAFPKTIWYTFKPNHTETSILTDEQKRGLRNASLQGIYWKK